MHLLVSLQKSNNSVTKLASTPQKIDRWDLVAPFGLGSLYNAGLTAPFQLRSLYNAGLTAPFQLRSLHNAGTGEKIETSGE